MAAVAALYGAVLGEPRLRGAEERLIVAEQADRWPVDRIEVDKEVWYAMSVLLGFCK